MTVPQWFRDFEAIYLAHCDGEDVDVPARMAELLGSRYAVARMVEKLDEHRDLYGESEAEGAMEIMLAAVAEAHRESADGIRVRSRDDD